MASSCKVLSCPIVLVADLCSARVALGIAEGGLFPGVSYYITMWYPRQIQGKRLAIFISATTVAGAFGGVFAYLIDHMDG